MPPKARGELAEIRFLLEAAARGLVVAKPWGDNLPYDFVVGGGRRWLRVQVKSTLHRVYRGYQMATMHRRKVRGYTVRDIDFLAAYVIPAQTWYLIPVKAFTGKLAIVLFPSRRPTRGGRFERYKEAWDLLSS
ncbi:MAG TPA: group I intron-associated PD-(D/E)XK endonuclease [Terriglobales bacterium]|nr:group I intron-associated PD-(D/E)XK endonuclease [Terriglobales bacterium]